VLVPKEGLEPSRSCEHRILNPKEPDDDAKKFGSAVLVSTCGVVSAQDTVANKDVLGRWIKAI